MQNNCKKTAYLGRFSIWRQSLDVLLTLWLFCLSSHCFSAIFLSRPLTSRSLATLLSHSSYSLATMLSYYLAILLPCYLVISAILFVLFLATFSLACLLLYVRLLWHLELHWTLSLKHLLLLLEQPVLQLHRVNPCAPGTSVFPYASFTKVLDLSGKSPGLRNDSGRTSNCPRVNRVCNTPSMVPILYKDFSSSTSITTPIMLRGLHIYLSISGKETRTLCPRAHFFIRSVFSI